MPCSSILQYRINKAMELFLLSQLTYCILLAIVRSHVMNNERTTEAANGQGPRPQTQPEWLCAVYTKVQSLKYGSVQVTVHDSKVVQIERVERTRFDRPDST